MKRIYTFLCSSATANPLFQNEEFGDEYINEEIGNEFVNDTQVFKEENTEDWQLVPDSDGNLHMVDINAFDEGMEPAFVASDVIFRLFTRQNPTTAQIVALNNNAQLTNSNYNPALQTRFHIHGN